MIVNLTQHQSSAEQLAEGVFDLPADVRATVSGLLTFTAPPQAGEVRARARDLALIAAHALRDAPLTPLPRAMIGGAGWLMASLELALSEQGIVPVYSFSERVMIEKTMQDGVVRKVADFKHLEFIVAPECIGDE